ncbi:MAG: rhomboid family intramembrane serine protease [Opitutales bacterium]|jgi:membrane associated rhomboid family serine protease|nr:rhomboid family intramembrane serine protease [Opitutales bacterium]MDP4659611.1 rhomboid family intramembrane serine protease [Opitutales bacterium]MDP4775914.1 rhomboid family intramembrane serine protease [Opitutales bacterium]MDP4787731.1 rhomboid family intramembrane serine protease [Opitutales bacterium]MDP4861375.1 rhomboid family intramembrane serine protease [Opitutales bacterium]
MGIGDRAYMRDQRPAREPISATAWVVGVLVGFFILNLIQESAGADLLGWAMLRESAPLAWQWLTHALLHDGFWHLLGNCLVLWWTGAIVEREHGPRVLLAILAAGTLFGAFAWALTGLGGDRSGLLIGISSGVYALMLVALLDKLDHQITLLLFFFLPVTLKVRWLLIAITLFTVLGWAFAELPGRHAWPQWHAAWNDSIAHSAHLGGLVLGWLAYRRLNQTNLRVQDAQGYVNTSEPDDAGAIARDAYAAEDNSGGGGNEVKPSASLTKGQARAELDTLLDKISAGGFGSLTAGEKRRLEELSARLR